MAWEPKTVAELEDQFRTNLETNLGQDSPIDDKAFLRVLATTEALVAMGIYKGGAVSVKQNLAISAYLDALKTIGENHGVPIYPKRATQLQLGLFGNGSNIVAVGTQWIGDDNGAVYRTIESTLTTTNLNTVKVQAVIPGEASNLEEQQYLTLTTNPAGINNTTAGINDVLVIGLEEEDIEDYRVRVLSELRTVGGGANGADHRRWGTIQGVDRLYPYSGLPASGVSYPVGYRSVFVKADEEIYGTVIAPPSLLAAVELAITTSPDDYEQTPLGAPPYGLFVQSVYLTNFDVSITGLVLSDATQLDNLKADVLSNLGIYFSTREPFITGIDVIFDKRETISKVSISTAVQAALEKYGAYATDINFNVQSGGGALADYTMNAGQLARAGDIQYV